MNFSYLKSPSGILKLIEIVLVVTTFGLVRDKRFSGFGNSPDAITNSSFFGVGMLTAAMVVTPLLLAVYLSGKMDIQKSIFEPVVNILFGVSFVVYGSLMLAFYGDKDSISSFYYSEAIWQRYYDNAMAASSLCLIAGVGYLVDLFFSIKNFRAFPSRTLERLHQEL